MATLALELSTTDAQDKALDWLLATLNAEHEANLRKPWPDVPTMLVALIQTLIGDQYGEQYQAARHACVAEALTRASPDQWAKVAEILQMKVP